MKRDSWNFVIKFPNGNTYIKACPNKDEAYAEMAWAKGRALYDNCELSIEEIKETSQKTQNFAKKT